MTRFYAAAEKCRECKGSRGRYKGADDWHGPWIDCPRCNGVGLEPYELVQVGWLWPSEIEGGADMVLNTPYQLGDEPVGRMEKVKE